MVKLVGVGVGSALGALGLGKGVDKIKAAKESGGGPTPQANDRYYAEEFARLLREEHLALNRMAEEIRRVSDDNRRFQDELRAFRDDQRAEHQDNLAHMDRLHDAIRDR